MWGLNLVCLQKMENEKSGHRFSRGRCLALVGLLAVCFALSSPTPAATLEVKVRERGGLPLEDLRVYVQSDSPGSSNWRRAGRGTTGPDGKVAIEGLEPGAYKITFGPPRDPDLVPPEHNPYVLSSVVTLPEDETRFQIEVEFWRGVQVSMTVATVHAELPRSSILLHHVETGTDIALPLPDVPGFPPQHRTRVHLKRTLVEGRWELIYDAPPSFLVREILVNGEVIPGGTVRLDIASDPRDQFVSWELAAPCEVWGRIVFEGMPWEDGTVRATLLEPGDWLEDESQRGRIHDLVVPYRWDHDPLIYFLRLPEGRWRIEPAGDSVAGSDPEFVEVALTAGEMRQEDFTVRTEGEGSGPALEVRVKTPDGRKNVSGAWVELYRKGDVGRQLPMLTDRTRSERYYVPPVRFTDLAPGFYEVVAGTADWLDGRVEVEIEEDPKKRPKVEIVLVEGSSVEALSSLAQDGTPVEQVEVTLEWQGDVVPSLLVNEELAAARKLRRRRTDVSGYASIHGLTEGSYTVSARVKGQHRISRYARIRQPGSGEAQESELHVPSSGKTEVDVQVYEGAVIKGTLSCDDGEPLPPVVSFQVYPEGELEGDPVLELSDYLLEGKFKERFTVGPLEGGAYLLAVRPEGFEPWGWMYGTDQSQEAAILPVVEGEELDLGAVEALCAPVVQLQPLLRSGEVVPDMQKGVYQVEGVRYRDNGEQVPLYPELEVRLQSLLIQSLEKGGVELEIRLEHPWLIPPVRELALDRIQIDRGVWKVLEVGFERLGGALQIKNAPAGFLMLEQDGLTVERQKVADGKTFFKGVRPGRYEIRVCRDEVCSEESGEVRQVMEVLPGRTVRIDWKEED